MAYVMVTADFPRVNTEQRNKIYDCLKKEKWIKVTEPGRDIDTVWYASFQPDVSEKRAIQIGIDDFVTSSKLYSHPKLALHWDRINLLFTVLCKDQSKLLVCGRFRIF